MSKRVLSVGQCGPDNATLKKFLKENFDVKFATADGTADALASLRAAGADLVLVNRKLDADYSDGMAVIEAIKAGGGTPVMLVSNYDDAQDAAVAAGAERGFGKLALNDETTERLKAFLA